VYRTTKLQKRLWHPYPAPSKKLQDYSRINATSQKNIEDYGTQQKSDKGIPGEDYEDYGKKRNE
jgi:hypothetical protein